MELNERGFQVGEREGGGRGRERAQTSPRAKVTGAYYIVHLNVFPPSQIALLTWHIVHVPRIWPGSDPSASYLDLYHDVEP